MNSNVETFNWVTIGLLILNIIDKLFQYVVDFDYCETFSNALI